MASIWRKYEFKYDMCTTARHVAVEYRIVRYTSIEVPDRQQKPSCKRLQVGIQPLNWDMMMPTSRLPFARDIGRVCLDVHW